QLFVHSPSVGTWPAAALPLRWRRASPATRAPPFGIYHVTTRGVARAPIFLNDDERRLFLRLFATVVDRHDWRVHVFCLMTNQYHLVVETELEHLSAGMQRLNG